jgi:hypothetical protein
MHSQGQPPVSQDAFRQLEVLVERLEAFITDYLDEARQNGIVLRPADVLDIIDDAIQAAGAPSEAAPDFAPTVEGAFLLGLYEEIVQQPSSIYEQKTLLDGTTTWVTLEPKIWTEVLRRVRLVLEKALTRG